MEGLVIRTAKPEDGAKLLEIYAPYVKNTAITFEYEVPTVDEFTARIEDTLKKYPYIIAEKDGETLGYAYLGALKTRAAYSRSAETSVYVKNGVHNSGIGKALYKAIEDIALRQNITNLYACIAYPDPEDEYLTRNSVEFHSHMGYKTVGHFNKCAYKFGRWYDMVWMEKNIGEHLPHAEELVPFCCL